MWNETEIREFEELTKPIPFKNVKRGIMLLKSIPERMLPLLAKIGVVKEFNYDDETQNVLFNHYVGGQFAYINTPLLLATVECSITEIHHIHRHFYYIGKGDKVIGGRGHKVRKDVRVIGEEVNEDTRSLRLLGTLRDVRIRVDKNYHAIDKAEHMKIVFDDFYGIKGDYKFDFTKLRNMNVERMIYAPYGAVDEEELLNMMEIMSDTLRQHIEQLKIADFIVEKKIIPQV